MTADEMVRRLGPWLARNCRPGWKPVVEEGDGPVMGSKFSGTPWIDPYAAWPDCGVCKKPLQLFLQLNLGDLPDELGGRFGTGLLQLFYCTRYNCQSEGGWEPFADDLSRVRVIQASGPGKLALVPEVAGYFPAKRVVGWDRFLDVPMPCEHEELGLTYSYNWDTGTVRVECPEADFDVTTRIAACPVEELVVSEHGDKLAGWPAWVQGVEYPHCPRCGKRMVLVFQVDSQVNIPFTFADGGCGHITQCPDHKDVVAFGWACA